MFKWFECKVRFEREQQDGAIKSTEEAYLVDAMSFTEAEARITLEMKPFVTSEFEVKNINNVRITEIVHLHEDYSDNKFFKSKVIYKTIDEKKGIEKKTSGTMYVKAADIKQALDELIKYMDKGGSDYEIANIAETAIMDVFEYAVMEKKDPDAPLGNSNAPVPPSVEE